MSLKYKFLTIMGIIGIIFVLRLSSIFLLIGMLPALVVILVDQHPEKLWSKTVFAFNLAGVYPYIYDLYYHQKPEGTAAILKQMSDSSMWLVVYGAAAGGYLAMWLCPQLAEFFMRIVNKRRIQNHQNKLRYLNDEWGIVSHMEDEDDEG